MVNTIYQNFSSTLLTFVLSIIMVFVGHFVREINLPMVDWLLITLIASGRKYGRYYSNRSIGRSLARMLSSCL